MITGTAAGVPFVARPPDGGARPDAPVVVAWHLLDAPCTETAFAAALPLTGLDAWRIYLGLPMTGARLPDGGHEELQRRAFADPVEQLYRHVIDGAVAEFPEAIGRPVAAAVDELRRRDATVQWHTVPGMAHALAEEPGVAPAPQTAHAAEVDTLAAAWFAEYLR